MASPHRQFERPEIQLLPIPRAQSKPGSPYVIRSLPELVYFNAFHNSDHVFCLQSKQSQHTTALDFTRITFRQLAQAVESCCSWILANVEDAHSAVLREGGIVHKAPPVALFLESDVSLFIYIAALLAVNIPCVLLSIRLNPTAVRHLLKETKALSIIISSRTATVIKEALSTGDESTKPQMKVLKAVPFEQFLVKSPSSDTFYHLNSCPDMVREDDRNVLILHSSGTTGLPKAISLAHRYLLGYATCHLFPPDKDESKCGINLSTLPLYHGFGVLGPCLALSVGKAVCLPPSSTIPNGTLILQLVKYHSITSLMTVPTILEDIILMEPSGLAARKLARLDFVAVGGGGIKDSVGLMLHANGVKLLNHFGATELGALAPIFRPDSTYDWRYLRLRTDLGLSLKPLNSDEALEGACKLIGYPFGWNAEFELQDSLENNPLHPGREVKILGRKDDLVVLATGEKVSPHFMEMTLEQDPLIRRAIVFGAGRSEVGVLVEPLSDPNGRSEEFIGAIWPTIVRANRSVDQHACISTKAAVLIKPSEKIIPLSDKGSPQRKEVYAVFESEIQSVYDRLERDQMGAVAVPIDPNDPGKSFRTMVQMCLPSHNKPGEWGDDEDFVHLGMDSLRATRLRRIVVRSLQQSGNGIPFMSDLPRDFIFTHPSISKLVEALQGLKVAHMYQYDRLQTMKDISNKYAFRDGGNIPDNDHVVLLTGSTGNLGAHLLQLLSEYSGVQKVICLIRTRPTVESEAFESDAIARQQHVLTDRGISLSENAWLKIEFLQWKAGAHLLGLTQEVFHRLAAMITHIFHGAWPMDFQRKLSSFEVQVKAVQDLVELARFAHRLRHNIKPRIVLASSIAVVGQLVPHSSEPTVPELPMHSPTAPLPLGYAEAKWVCEQVMESAYNTLQREVQPMIVRIGQLSGSQSTGCWSSKEHIPALIKASLAVGKMPDLHGSLSWLSVDQAARVLVDLLLRSEPRDLVYHLENPVRQSWEDICSIIERKLGLPLKSRLPFEDWLKQISTLEDSPSDLMEFFSRYFLRMSSGSLVLDTTNSRRLSPTLRSTGAIQVKEIGLYLDYWRQSGFLK